MAKFFVTEDTAFAAYLYLLGYQFKQGTVWTENSYRKKYVVFDDDKRVEHEEDFYLRRTSVAPLDFQDARIQVSKFLRREIRDPRMPTVVDD